MSPLAAFPASSTLGLNWFAYDRDLNCVLRLATCWRSMSPLLSVNGMVKTVGSVPPASWAANVVAFHSYSLGWILMVGFCVSKSLTWALKVSNAAFSLPGFSETTLSVTLPGFLSSAFFLAELQAASAAANV